MFHRRRHGVTFEHNLVRSYRSKSHPLQMLLPIFIMMISLWTNCDHIFSSDEIQLDRRTINGMVKLSQESNFSNILVFLDGINIGTFTDANGTFKLTLPPNLGVSGSAISGIFDLYFYLANYNINKLRVVIQHGQFVFGQEGLDKNGKVTPSPMLTRALRIETSLAPGYRGVASSFATKVRITAETNPVPVDLPNGSQEFLGGALLHNLATDSVYKKIMYTAGYTQIYHFTAYQSGRDFFFIFDTKELHLPPGHYRVVPHVLPNYDALAKKIADYLGIDPTILSRDFLQWPMRCSGGEFTIAEDKPEPPN